MPSFLPNQERKILLHCCCAPCSGYIIEMLLEKKVEPTLFFYNPNIHPYEEYEKRKKEIQSYAKKRNVPFIDAAYEQEEWFCLTQGHEKEPERGKRCSICFEMRLRKTAQYAVEHQFSLISTTLGISRWKDFDQVTQAGKNAVASFAEVDFFEYNWRKENASLRNKEISNEEGFYRQTFCGCIFSSKILF